MPRILGFKIIIAVLSFTIMSCSGSDESISAPEATEESSKKNSNRADGSADGNYSITGVFTNQLGECTEFGEPFEMEDEEATIDIEIKDGEIHFLSAEADANFEIKEVGSTFDYESGEFEHFSTVYDSLQEIDFEIEEVGSFIDGELFYQSVIQYSLEDLGDCVLTSDFEGFTE